MAQTWNKYKLPNGPWVITGSHAFTASGATVELDAYCGTIISATFAYAKSADLTDTELLYLQEALAADGNVDVDDDGQVTVGRQVETGGSLTSGAAFTYQIIGY